MHSPIQIRLTFNQDRPHEHEDDSTGLAVQEAKPKLQAPPMYKVLMFNDDYTPMDFVVEVLEVFFGMNREMATKVMLTVHTEGKAVCGVFTRDIAETKADRKSTRLNSSHVKISYAVFCLKKKRQC